MITAIKSVTYIPAFCSAFSAVLRFKQNLHLVTGSDFSCWTFDHPVCARYPETEARCRENARATVQKYHSARDLCIVEIMFSHGLNRTRGGGDRGAKSHIC